MSRIVNKIFILLLAFIISSSQIILAQENSSSEMFDFSTSETKSEISKDEAKDYFDQAVSIIMSRYKFDVNKEDLYKDTIYYLLEKNPEIIYELFSGMFGSLDKYTTYYTDEEIESLITGLSGEICGIGVMITTVDEGLVITNVYENSPAIESGLMVGDIITGVGEVSFAGMDINIAQSYVLGEAGTTVSLNIKRNGSVFKLDIVRRHVTVSNGFYQCLENDTIGYIYLNQFDEHVADFAQTALSIFDSKNITDIIIDLRNNPGGALNGMVELSNLFLPAGPVINLEYKNPFKNTVLFSENYNPKYNLIVLVNENSASASEAFAAAVQDTGVGIVVGSQSFGKGTMQNLTHFKIGGGIKMTEAEFLSPNRRTINGVGVTPDVFIEDKTVAYEYSNFKPITYDRVLKEGDKGDDVLAIEERYYALGLSVGIPDGVYDKKTYAAALNFQKITGLYPYGVTDITTQLKIEAILNGSDVVLNDSLDRAIEIFKSEEWENYKNDWSNTK